MGVLAYTFYADDSAGGTTLAHVEGQADAVLRLDQAADGEILVLASLPAELPAVAALLVSEATATDPAIAALAYSTGHHNWFDDADALVEGETCRAHMQYQPEDPEDYLSDWVWSCDLTGLDPSSAEVLWGPIPLELTYPDSPW